MVHSLRQKLVIVFLGVFFCAVGALAYFSYHISREAMLNEFHIRGRELAKAIALESQDFYRHHNIEGFTSLLQSLGEAEGVLAVLAYDASQRLWVESSIIELTSIELTSNDIHSDNQAWMWDRQWMLKNGQPISEFGHAVPQDSGMMERGTPEGRPQLGWIRILFDRTPLENRLNRILTQTFAVSGITAIIGGLMLIYLLRRSLTIITPLMTATQKVAQGDLQATVPISSQDELGQLARCFNQMTERLHATTVSKHYVDNILESMINSVIVMDATGRITSVNHATLRLLEYPQAELVGDNISVIFPPQENPFKGSGLNDLLRNQTLPHIETVYVTKDYRHIPVLFSAAAMFDSTGHVQGIACVAQDITERKQAETALRESVERFDMAVRGSRDGLWDAWANPDNLFHPDNPIYFSPRFKELLGFRDEEFPNVIGSWAACLHPEDLDKAFLDLQRHLEERVPYDSEYRMITKSGECRWFAGRGQAVWDAQGRPLRMSGSFSDITDRKRAQEELQAAHAKLQEIDRLRTQFFADISHELRTPLTVIRGEAEVTLRGKDKPLADYKETLKRIVQLTNEVNKLVNDLLFLARSESGALQIELQPLDIQRLLHESLQEVKTLAAGKSIHLTGNSLDSPVVILGDPQRIRQLLMILLDNAVKYTNQGGTIQATLETRQREAVVSISDNGIGIPEEDLQQVFQRFYRVKRVETGGPGGAGLGLPIAKWITEAHNGSIAVSSRSGQGTTVTIQFPLTFRDEDIDANPSD